MLDSTSGCAQISADQRLVAGRNQVCVGSS
jgi:hypothetical protein